MSKQTKWRMISLTLMVVGAVLAVATGHAMAATAPWTISAPLTNVGNFVQNDIGYTTAMCGLAGWGSQVMRGHDLGQLSEHATKFVIAGGSIYEGGALLGGIGLAPGATFHGDPIGLAVGPLIVTNLLLFAVCWFVAVQVKRADLINRGRSLFARVLA